MPTLRCGVAPARYSIGVSSAKGLYSVHPAVAMAQKGVGTLKEKTGLSSDKERRAWLKSKYGLGLNYASWIVNDFSSLGLGKDVKACPCKTMVPLYRKHVFAQIKPTTLTRIDLGFALGARPATGRLIDTGGYAKKDRITHRIPISSPAEIDGEVKQWLHTAYEEDR
jgi:hypothetical protein